MSRSKPGKSVQSLPRKATKGKVPGRQGVKKRRVNVSKKYRPNLSAFKWRSKRSVAITDLSSGCDSDGEDNIRDQTLRSPSYNALQSSVRSGGLALKTPTFRSAGPSSKAQTGILKTGGFGKKNGHRVQFDRTLPDSDNNASPPPPPQKAVFQSISDTKAQGCRLPGPDEESDSATPPLLELRWPVFRSKCRPPTVESNVNQEKKPASRSQARQTHRSACTGMGTRNDQDIIDSGSEDDIEQGARPLRSRSREHKLETLYPSKRKDGKSRYCKPTVDDLQEFISDVESDAASADSFEEMDMDHEERLDINPRELTKELGDLEIDMEGWDEYVNIPGERYTMSGELPAESDEESVRSGVDHELDYNSDLDRHRDMPCPSIELSDRGRRFKRRAGRHV